MLRAAICGSHPLPILTHLLHTFPQTTIYDSTLEAALALSPPNRIPTFTALLTYSPSILNRELESTRNTPLSSACWGDNPSLALFLLAQGADPNQGSFMRLTALDIALLKQPLSLIEALVRGGAQVDGGTLKNAVEFGRVDAVGILGKVVKGVERKGALEKAESEGMGEMVRALREGEGD
jgi:ankyrin repeat protein